MNATVETVECDVCGKAVHPHHALHYVYRDRVDREWFECHACFVAEKAPAETPRRRRDRRTASR